MATPDGECATARACNLTKTPMILSAFSSTSIEEMAVNAPDSLKIYHLYLTKDREHNINLLKRAKESGFNAIAWTIDT